MAQESDCRSTPDPYFHAIADDVAVLVKDGAKGDLFAFMALLLLDEKGGIKTPRHSLRLDPLLDRLATLIDVQAGRRDAWTTLESDIRRLDYNQVYEDSESGHKWSEYNAIVVMGLLAKAGGCISAGEFVGRLNDDLSHHLLQAVLDAGQFHAVRERATHELPSVSSQLYDERVAQKRNYEQARDRMWKRAEEVSDEAHRQMRYALHPLADACRGRRRVAQAAAEAAKPRWGLGWLLGCLRTA